MTNKTENYIQEAINMYGDAFTPIDAKLAKETQTILSPLDVFVWVDEIYLVGRRNKDVRCCDGSMATNNWVWNYQGEKQLKIGTITEEKLIALIKSSPDH